MLFFFDNAVDAVGVELMIKETIYGGCIPRRWLVCSDTQIVRRVSVCAPQIACGYQQPDSRTGECRRWRCVCVCVCASFMLAVNLLDIDDVKFH